MSPLVDFDDRNGRSCWVWQPYTGAMVKLLQQIREQGQSHTRSVDVALKRAAKKELDGEHLSARNGNFGRAHSCCPNLATMP